MKPGDLVINRYCGLRGRVICTEIRSDMSDHDVPREWCFVDIETRGSDVVRREWWCEKDCERPTR